MKDVNETLSEKYKYSKVESEISLYLLLRKYKINFFLNIYTNKLKKFKNTFYHINLLEFHIGRDERVLVWEIDKQECKISIYSGKLCVLNQFLFTMGSILAWQIYMQCYTEIDMNINKE